ncbi:MAG TPA: 2Fe-2S iron-sulfur cluster-binding protein, partial [Streptomyces sp.]|nr:2Fe-2S iron-sulfur cluster-binding protein [Streptomyces sp.]
MSNGNPQGDPHAHPHANPDPNPHANPDAHPDADQRGDGYGDRYGYGQGYGYGEGAQQSYPQEGWGGEYDADATAFVQLPTGPLPPAGAGAGAWGPLAAPGTGQGGYTPPPLDPADVAGQSSSAHVTPPATTDPAATGHWAHPFGQEAPGQGGQGQQGPGGPSYAQQYAQEQYAQQQYAQEYSQRYAQEHAQQQEHARQQEHERERAHQQEQQLRAARSPFPSAPPGQPGGPGESGTASAMGQGAAAALAGSHEARTQRRPLGSGGGAAGDEAEPIGPGTSFGRGQAEQQQDTGGGAQFAEAHARRQVPFGGHGDAAGPGTGVPEGEARAYASPHEDDGMQGAGSHESANGAGATHVTHATHTPQATETAEVAEAGESSEATDGGGLENFGGTVRSGLPFTPSAGPSGNDSTATGQWATAPAEQDGPPHGNGWGGNATAVPGTETDGAAANSAPSRQAPPAETASAPAAPDETVPSGDAATDEGVSEEPAVALAPQLGGEHPHVSYVLHVNGVDRPVTDAWIGESLLYVLRERLGLAGAKDGCSQGECGACSVQVDGRLVASCLVPAATSAGSEIRTVEGLATDGEPSDVQRALTGSGAV